MTTFTMTLAQTIYDSNDQFPINFDDAWQWLGYSRKDNAKRTLVKNFERDFDFLINEEATTTGISHIPTELIYISIDCFKQLAMMSKTDIGKVARKYFIECEKIAKEAIAAKLAPLSVTQGLLNELYDTTKLVCFNDNLADMALHGSLQYQKKLDPQLEATVRVGYIRATLRLGKSPEHSMESIECENTINKQFRHTQDAMEGYDTVAPELRPKSELADIKRARELNPSSVERELFTLEKLSQDELAVAKRIDLNNLKNPTVFGNIEQLPLFQGTNNPKQIKGDTNPPQGFIIDIPLDNIH